MNLERPLLRTKADSCYTVCRKFSKQERQGAQMEIKQIYPGIYQVQLPLRGNPLKELNCYIIKGSERSLVVDTAFNQEEARSILLGALEQLECPPFPNRQLLDPLPFGPCRAALRHQNARQSLLHQPYGRGNCQRSLPARIPKRGHDGLRPEDGVCAVGHRAGKCPSRLLQPVPTGH